MLCNHPITPIQQDFQVSFRYPVHFTRDLFAADNPLFPRRHGAAAADPPPKLLVVLDRGV